VFLSPEDDPREAGGEYEGERATLVRYLRDRRLTLEMKCSGLEEYARHNGHADFHRERIDGRVGQ
jgi:hypothetical protein